MAKSSVPIRAAVSTLFVLFPLALFLTTSDLAAGTVLRLHYKNIPGDKVENLTSHSSFPSRPSSEEALTEALEKLDTAGDNFGAWIRGYIEAPQTGAYTFWIASDNDSEFRLSTDETPEKLEKICENAGFVEPRNYFAKGQQRSRPIQLTKAQKYYFEVLWKEGAIGDHFSVGWQLPDGTIERPIPATRLMPLSIDEKFELRETAPKILTEYSGKPVATLTNVLVEENGTATFVVTAEATQPATFQWFRNHVPIPDANLSTLTLTNVRLINDVDVYSVVVSNKLGSASAEAVLSVIEDKTPPTILSVLNAGVGDELAVVFSEPVERRTATDIRNYKINTEAPLHSARIGSNPRIVMLRCGPLAPGRTHEIAVSNVADSSENHNVIAPNSKAQVETGLQVWVQFDEWKSAGRTNDGAGLVLPEIHGQPKLVGGRVGSAMHFDGENDSLQWPERFEDFSNGMTVMVWARPTAPKAWARFIDLANGPFSNNILFGRLGRSDGLFFEVYDGKDSTGQVIASAAIQLNEWQHFAATVDSAGKVAIYKNGTVAMEGSAKLPPTVKRMTNYIARSNWVQDERYAGDLDDLRIYNRPLATAEIEALVGLAASPDITPPALVGAVIPATNRVAVVFSEPVDLKTATASGNYVIDGAVITQAEMTSSPDMVLLTTKDLDTTKPHLLRVKSIKDRASTPNSTEDTSIEIEAGLSVWLKFDDVGATNLTADGLGKNISAVLMNGAEIAADGVEGGCLALDGTDDYARLPEGFESFPNGLTFAFWAKPRSKGAWARFLDFGNGVAHDNILFSRSFTSDDLCFEVYKGPPPGDKTVAPQAIEQDKWQHFTVRVDKSGHTEMFKDGNFLVQHHSVLPPEIVRTNNFIGKSNWPQDAFYAGNMDDFRLYQRPLSDSEIRALATIPMLSK